jgi:hypothetical protein
VNYTLVIVAGLAIGSSCVLIAGRAGVRWGFLFWICTLGLGYRTLPATENFRIHPSVVTLLVVFLWLLLTTSSKVQTKWWIPAWVWASVPFWYWGWMVGRQSDFDWDAMLSQLQSFVIFIPLFVVAATVLQDKRDWKTVVLVFYVTAVFVAVLGLLEYYYPGIRGVFPQFVSNTDPNIGNDGFARAPFSFWGHPAAVFLCAMAIPLMIPIMTMWRPRQIGQIVMWVSFALLPMAVYQSGYRALWLYMGIQFIIWLLLNRHYGLGIIGAAAAVSGYAALPESTRLRVESFILALQGTPVETSGADHLGRLTDAWHAIWDYPLGLGWTGSGWVHNDFLQVAADLGVLAGLIFAGAFLWTAFGLFQATLDRRRPDRPLYVGLLLSFLTAGGIMSTQVICVLPQLALPVWLIWVLGVIAVRQRRACKEVKHNGRANFRFAANLQLREYGARYAGVRSARV